jgi:hypothetical protein
MSSWPLWLKIIAIVFVAAPGFYHYVVAPRLRSRSRRLLDRTRTTAIAALREGELAKIAGVVAAREALVTSPVGEHPCIGFRLSIDQRPSKGAGEIWIPVVVRTACGSFSVTDDTGTVVVEGPFRIDLDPDDSAWANLPPAVFSLLEEAAGPSALKSIGDEQTRFQEALLKPGDRIRVLGRPTLEIDPAGRGSSRDPPRLNHIRGTGEEPVVIADEEDPI